MAERTAPDPQTEPLLLSRETWQAEIARCREVGNAALSVLIRPGGIMDLDDPDIAYDAVEVLLSSEISEDAAEIGRHIHDLRKRTMVSIAPDYRGDNIETDIRSGVLADSRVRDFVNDRDRAEERVGFMEVWPRFEKAFVNGIRQGIGQGYIPAGVEARLGDALSKTIVRVMGSAVAEVVGYEASYEDAKDEIWIASGENDIKNLVHEFTHQISGGTFRAAPSSAFGCIRIRGGFSAHTPDGYSKVGLDEALTEHITRGILDGDFETIDPDEREDRDRTYYPYRKVVATFIARSGGHVDTKMLIGAFFEDTRTGGSIEARRRLVEGATAAYGIRALGLLEELLEQCDEIDDYEFDKVFTEGILSAIHPPVINQQGTVTRAGCIDLGHARSFIEKYNVDFGNMLRDLTLSETQASDSLAG